jgi:hypothetical protein
MGLMFCCPSCGANLRVTADVAPLVSCPGCGEPIRVPKRPHPVETVASDSAFSPGALTSARSGLRRLLLSLTLSSIAAVVAVAAVGLRLSVGPPTPDRYPDWFPAVGLTLAGLWVSLAVFACGFRLSGYERCRPLAAAVGVEAWAKAAAAGTGLTALGVIAAVPWLLGRPVLTPSPELIGLVLVGLTAGLVGVGIEFAFLTVLHRLLWETAGWKAANGTSRYTMEFVFATVAGMGSVCLGGMAAVVLIGGKTPGGIAPPELKWVGAAVLAALVGCVGWSVWRYGRLLMAALKAVGQPAPHPPTLTNRRA